MKCITFFFPQLRQKLKHEKVPFKCTFSQVSVILYMLCTLRKAHTRCLPYDKLLPVKWKCIQLLNNPLLLHYYNSLKICNLMLQHTLVIPTFCIFRWNFLVVAPSPFYSKPWTIHLKEEVMLFPWDLLFDFDAMMVRN